MIQLLSFKCFCLCDPPVRVYNAEEVLTKLRLCHCGIINIITVIFRVLFSAQRGGQANMFYTCGPNEAMVVSGKMPFTSSIFSCKIQ